MNTTYFSLLFPEVDNPSKLLNTLVGKAHSRHLPEHEFYTILHELSLKRNNYEGYAQNPTGYITRCFENACNDYFKEERKTTSLDDNLIVETCIEPDFDAKDFFKKLAELDLRLAKYDLNAQAHQVLQILKELAENDHSSVSNYFKEVREKAALKNITYSNLRKIIERIREKLGADKDMRDGLMSFVPNEENTEVANFLDIIISNIKVPALDAYRFSQEEMKKMSAMQNSFSENQLFTGRFPEVYYNDFDDAAELFPSLKKNKRIDYTPDYLGVYISAIVENELMPEEGIIILFKKEIEKFSDGEYNIDDVRMIVLMHELGHWLTHMSTTVEESKENKTTIKKPIPGWTYGYFEPHLTLIIEGLANVITYWSCESDNEYKVLNSLTPKNEDGTIDIENPYGVYSLLLHKEKSEIINKIAQISRVFYVEEKELLQFLISEILHFADFVASKTNTKFVKHDILEKIKEDYPSEYSVILKQEDYQLNINQLFPAESSVEQNNTYKGSSILARQQSK
jgi:hypothetical protein